MKHKILILSIVLTLLINIASKAQTTKTYYSNDSLKLELDLYTPKILSSNKNPLFIYLHSGNQPKNSKEDGQTICKYLAENGFMAASISYKQLQQSDFANCNETSAKKIMNLQFVASQLWAATSFFLKQTDTFNIDITKIFAGGSSFGAEAILHAIYSNYETVNLLKIKKPDNFRFAGIVSNSGAVLDINFLTKKNAIPMLLCHGTCDKVIPYEIGANYSCKPNAKGWLMLFGSYSIFNRLNSLNKSVYLLSICGGGHEYNSELFVKNKQPVLDFLKMVQDNIKFSIHIVQTSGKDCEETKYPFCE